MKPEPDALIFTGQKGGALRRPNFNQRTKWTEIVTKLGLSGLHFHDPRHAGNIWAGMSTKDLMARMGHDDMRAALIYQRATSEADKQIADRLSKMVDRHWKGEADDDEDASDDDDKDGSSGVPAPVG